MNRNLGTIFAGLCGLAAFTLSAIPAAAQAQEVKEKPPMFSYVADWQVSRANWADMDKTIGPVNETLEKALADGLIIGHGSDTTLVHTPNDSTHDVWWSSMSMGGILKALDRIHQSPEYKSMTLNDAKHWDEVFVSHYYNWKPGAFKHGYTHVGVYKLKADAPDDAIDNLSKHFVVPILEKLLSDGTVIEYEIDEQAIHTEAPGMFFIIYLTPTADGIDTVQAAVRDAAKAHVLGIQAFGSYTDDSGHRDSIDQSDGVYK